MYRHLLLLIGAGLAAGAVSHPAAAQGVSAVAQQPLSFGTLIPGVSQTVSAGDVVRRGEVLIQGAGQYTVQIVLPTVLSGPNGARLPLLFGAADGQLDLRNKTSVFDPRTGTTVKLNKNDSATIGIGGTAQPAASQAAGTYTGTIVVLVAN